MPMAKPIERGIAQKSRTTFTQWLCENYDEEPINFSDLLNMWRKFRMTSIKSRREDHSEKEKEKTREDFDWYFNCLEKQ